MNRKGVEFTLIQVQPGLWKWKFQIGETITTGKTQSSLMVLLRAECNSGLTVSLASHVTWRRAVSELVAKRRLIQSYKKRTALNERSPP